jgi:AraC family transcriptional regulator
MGIQKLDHLTIDYSPQNASEMPESLLTKHRIILNLGNHFVVEQWYNGEYQKNQMNTGDFTFLPIGMSRRVIWDRSIEFLLLDLDSTYLQEIMEILSDGKHPNQIQLIPHYKRHDSLIHQLGLGLKNELQNNIQIDRSSSKLYVESMMMTLTLQLLRHHTAITPIAQNSIATIPKSRLDILTDYIRNNLDGELGLDELANILQINKFYLMRLFKRSSGYTLHQYVTKCRIEKSKELLARRNNNLSILEICYSVGFESQSHFTKVFNRYVGVTPSVYRDR